MFHRCRQHPATNMIVGALAIADGLVRVLSLGLLGSDMTLRFISWHLRRAS